MTLALSPKQPPEARYPEHMMVAEAQPTGDVHFQAFRQGRNGLLWIEVEGPPSDPGCDVLLSLTLNRAQAAELGAMIFRMLAETDAAHAELVARNNTLDDRVAALNLCLNAMHAVQAELVAALRSIEGLHVPDQPLSSACDEHVWVRRHVAKLRGIAAAALAKLEQPA